MVLKEIDISDGSDRKFGWYGFSLQNTHHQYDHIGDMPEPCPF